MGYKNDKAVIFSLIKRVDYSKTQVQIDFDLGYDMGDYNFGAGDSAELRKKIRDTIAIIKIQFNGVFDEECNTIK